MVEILAGALSASCFGFESSSYFTARGSASAARASSCWRSTRGRSPKDRFGARLEDLLAAIEEQPGTRLPGQRRFALREQAERDGVAIPRMVYEHLVSLRG